MAVKVSVIITILNGGKWIKPCFESILNQTGRGSDYNLEVCVFDDASVDDTVTEVVRWQDIFHNQRIELNLIRSELSEPNGVGYGRNVAIKYSSGEYLCFQDIDDVMFPTRVLRQLELCQRCGDRTIIGSRFTRNPTNSTTRFTNWANSLPTDKLGVQIYTSNGPTVIMPTWFCHRNVFNTVGRFETGCGVPEDLIFFYNHIDRGGKIHRVDEALLTYTYHPNAATFSIKSDTIWRIRFAHLVKNVLTKKPWAKGFTIWNAGKQGRRFYRCLPDILKLNVLCFCDVDKKLIGSTYSYYDEKRRREIGKVPIVNFLDAKPPIIICFKLDLSQGSFEKNLQSLNLVEGKDYILFS